MIEDVYRGIEFAFHDTKVFFRVWRDRKKKGGKRESKLLLKLRLSEKKKKWVSQKKICNTLVIIDTVYMETGKMSIDNWEKLEKFLTFFVI